MLYNEFNEFLEVARKRQIIFFYAGYFSQHVVASISDAIKARLDSGGAAGPTRRKIFSSFVEMSQNIMHYSSDTLTPENQTESQMRRGSCCIGINEGSFFLLCANPIATENVEKMRTKLESLHSMSLQQIKDAYKKALREEIPQGSQGSGLGFLTMARDASEPMEFEFVQDAEDPNTTIFCIKAII